MPVFCGVEAKKHIQVFTQLLPTFLLKNQGERRTLLREFKCLSKWSISCMFMLNIAPHTSTSATFPYKRHFCITQTYAISA